LHDAYLPHTFEEIKALVPPEVAAKLDPTKSYGVDWYNRRGTVTDANGRRSKGTEKPREEWIAVPVPDAGIPAEVVARARASLKGSKPSKAAGRYWQLSGHAYCACGCRLISRTTRRSGKAYSYYVCSRYVRDGSGACPHGKWHNAVKLERRVHEALRSVKPQDLRAQIQAQIDRVKAPEGQIKAAHEVLEDVGRKREKYQEMFAADVMSLEELKAKLSGLDARKATVERELEGLNNSGQWVQRLRWLHEKVATNPIIAFLADTEETRREYYRDLELKVTTSRKDVAISGVFGESSLPSVTPTSTPATGK
jgi:hypothetical protein